MSREIIDSIQIIAGTKKDNSCKYIFCTVSSVNAAGRVCSCTPQAGNIEAPFTNVLLMAAINDGILYLPTIGSTVVVGYSNRYQPYIAMFSSIDKILYTAGNSTLQITDGLILLNDGGAENAAIQLNDGSFGGLTKTLELQAQLDKTTQLLEALLTAINGSVIAEPGNGSPSALQAVLKTALAGQQLGSFDNIENTKITHGI